MIIKGLAQFLQKFIHFISSWCSRNFFTTYNTRRQVCTLCFIIARREKQQPSRVIGRLMDTCFCRTVGRPFLAGCLTLPLIAVISGAASRHRTPWRRYKVPSAVPEGKEPRLCILRVCRRFLARARSCFTRSKRTPGEGGREGARSRWAWPRGPFLPLWSEYHYRPRYISTPINMEMRLIDPPNKPPRRYVAFPRARPLWFSTGSSNGRPNDRLMTLGNKARFYCSISRWSSRIFKCSMLLIAKFIFRLNILEVHCII